MLIVIGPSGRSAGIGAWVSCSASTARPSRENDWDVLTPEAANAETDSPTNVASVSPLFR
jgi:hypothetical protein